MIDGLLRVLTSDCSSDCRCFPTPRLPMTKVPVARAQTPATNGGFFSRPSVVDVDGNLSVAQAHQSTVVWRSRVPESNVSADPPGSRTATQMAFCSCSSQSNARIQRGSHLVNVVAHLAQMPKRFLASTVCSHIKHSSTVTSHHAHNFMAIFTEN